MAYNLPNVKPHVVAIANAVGPRFGITTIYGYRANDPYPDHPAGLALDFMTSSMATGTALAQYLIDNASAFGVDYIIWNRRSWNSKRRTWVTYTGSNPHTDHVHMTALATPGTGIQQLGLGGTDVVPTALPYAATLEKLEKLAALVGDKTTWIRIGLVFAGLAFIFVSWVGMNGATRMVKDTVKGLTK